ncbi:MAG: hypothetical protein GXP27_09215 [Planctomycetes bacterium]|nr:hypothetical protein [Planctomycetota bacterium]
MQYNLVMDHAAATSRTSLLKAVLAAGVALAIHLFVTFVLIVFLGGVVPHYVRFFEAHDTSLPAMTQQLILLSWWNVERWYLFVLAVLALDGPIALGVQFLPKHMRWIKACWFDSYLLAAFVFLFFNSVALCIPIEGMIEQAAGP